MGAKTEKTELIIRSFNVLPFDAKSADTAAEIQKDLAKSGKPASAADLLIAATCIAHGAELLTLDKGFKRFKRHGLKISSP